MAKTAGDIVSEYSLGSCISCGMCSTVCPSCRNGGIRPDALICSITSADRSSDLQELQADVWKCLMCHRCSMICKRGIDVTGAIRALRFESVSSGDMPKRFKMASDTLMSEGRAFPANESAHRRRKELGLDEIKDNSASVEELKKIIASTGFRYE